MSGKPYNIQELKIIVDYLVENKLYAEIKARKMWVDLANSKRTTRTWQSLKETFLKRILPDIHNPYFQLNNEQISSFRSRCNLSDKNKTKKLEIHTISDESNSNGHDPKDNEPSNEGETTAGENIQCSKVAVRNRSSADTVILENCYETAEQIQKELESNDSDKNPAESKSKSFRDCITYSEPLTPMLQEVWDDFASEPEDSDREGQMEIVENVPEDNQNVPEPDNEISITAKSPITDVAKNAEGLSTEVVEEVLAQELDGGSKPESMSPEEKTPNATDKINEKSPITDNIEELANLVNEISSMTAEIGSEKTNDADANTSKATKNSTTEVAQDSANSVQSGGLPNSNITVDASLPNNQEALDKKTPESLKKFGRKRSFSEGSSSTVEFKKKKLDSKSQASAKAEAKFTESHLHSKAEDRPKGNGEFIKPKVIKKPLLEDQPTANQNVDIDVDKPSTSFVPAHVINIIETEKKSPEIKNPCLQNISLFDEQFNKTRHNMSESSDTELNKKETKKQEASTSKHLNDPVVLKSNSESDTEEVHALPKKKQRAGVLLCKTERDKASMFGFSTGGVGAKRKLQLSRRRRTISHNNAVSHHTVAPASNSSDWTSESGSDSFVSPPRSRKNRGTRKYMKPHSHNISALEEDGGLFVMCGKRIYPLIKDGKIVKNYTTYLPESDSEDGENYWKQKYVTAKKKASELKKLLEASETCSSVAQAAPLRDPRKSSQAGPSIGVAKEAFAPLAEKKEEAKLGSPEKIKIKFTKNNGEVYLEGHWLQIHPVLEQVVQILNKEAEMPAIENKSRLTLAPPEQTRPKEGRSRSTSPIIMTSVDPEIHEKVNELEKEIFKEIEERDKEEDDPNEQVSNVTKRQVGRPRKSSSSINSPEIKPKIPKTSNVQETKESEESSRTGTQDAEETENNSTQENAPKPQAESPRKVLNETVNIYQTRTRLSRRSAQKLDTSIPNVEEEARYMLPPQNTRRSANKKTNKKKR